MNSQIDWKEQWALFAPGFREGRAHLLLEDGEEIALQTGPGFGDASHPTTNLMLKEMAGSGIVKGKVVFDIGCGSGILSVADGRLGAKEVFATDIDSEAEYGVKVAFTSPFPLKPTVLMNMILTEQLQVWNTYYTRPDHKLGILYRTPV